MNLVAWLSLSIAAASLTLSAWLAWARYHDKGQAGFTAAWGRETVNGMSMVYVVMRNEGPGTAHDVTATITSSNMDFTIAEDPVPLVPSGQTTRIPHVVGGVADSPPGPLRIEWRDNRTTRQSVNLHLGPMPRNPGTQRDSLDEAVRHIAEQVATDITKQGIERLVRDMTQGI